MAKLPRISESEQLVMKVVWAEEPVGSSRIIELLSDTTKWRPKTISTLLNRLVKKGAIGYRQSGRRYSYYPLIEEEAFVKSKSRSFLKRVFGGSAMPMLVTMVESGDVTLEDIEGLKRILSEKREE